MDPQIHIVGDFKTSVLWMIEQFHRQSVKA